MWIIAKITPAVNWPALLCPAIAKNQGGPGPCAPPFSYAHGLVKLQEEVVPALERRQQCLVLASVRSYLMAQVVVLLSSP